jgi:hypothetical protein
MQLATSRRSRSLDAPASSRSTCRVLSWGEEWGERAESTPSGSKVFLDARENVVALGGRNVPDSDGAATTLPADWASFTASRAMGAPHNANAADPSADDDLHCRIRE